MSLRSIDISKINRLSLRNKKAEAQNKPILSPSQPLTAQEYKSTPTDEKALDKPVLKALEERLGLKVLRVGTILDEGRRYTKKEAVDQILEKIGGYQNIKAGHVMKNKGGSFTYYNLKTGKEEGYKDKAFLPSLSIKAETKGARAKAETIFNRMLSKGTVEPIGDTGYYLLSGSTPF